MDEVKETRPMKTIKIISKFNCQSFPLDETAIAVAIEDLEQIGITKCFDVKKNKVINYDNSKDIKKKEAELKINELKANLNATDYKAIKFFEGQMTEEEYAPIKEQRISWRKEINELETNQGE